MLVVALLCTAIPASALVRESRSADSGNRNESYPAVQAPPQMGRLVTERPGGRHRIQPFLLRHDEADHPRKVPDGSIGSEAPAGIYSGAERDIAITGMIEHIRNVE